MCNGRYRGGGGGGGEGQNFPSARGFKKVIADRLLQY